MPTKHPGISEKAQATRIKNWNILILRGMYAKAVLITDYTRREVFKHIIDTELEVLGAESETARRAKALEE